MTIRPRSIIGMSRLDKDKVSPTASSAGSHECSPVRNCQPSSSLPYHRSFSTISPYASVSDISLPLSAQSSGSSAAALVYTKGLSTPAPANGSTVKLVHDGRNGHPCLTTQFSSETVVDMPEVIPQEQDDQAESEKEKGPVLSLYLTLTLLVVVTVVRNSLD